MQNDEIYGKAINLANNAQSEKQFAKAISMLMDIADGNPQAAFDVFSVFLRGGHIEQACFYLRLAARQGHKSANITLAKYLCEGRYFEQNDKVAAEILSRYTDDPAALCALGYIYLTSEQIDRDAQKAIDYLSKSASMGNYQASYNIALICAGETGLPKNDKQMFDWLATAMAQGSGNACLYAAHKYSELEKYAEAYNCLARGTELGHTECKLMLQKMKSAFGASPTYQNQIFQSQYNEAAYSHTGQREEILKREIKRQTDIEKRRETMDAAAEYLGGTVNYETGFGMDGDGNVFTVDDQGGIYTEQGLMSYDKDSSTLTDGNIRVHFEKWF